MPPVLIGDKRRLINLWCINDSGTHLLSFPLDWRSHQENLLFSVGPPVKEKVTAQMLTDGTVPKKERNDRSIFRDFSSNPAVSGQE